MNGGSALETPQAVVARLVEIMETRGGTRYDEAVTQCEHALQAGVLAAEAHAPGSLVLAALLHDVGHLLLDEHDGRPGFLGRDRQHEAVGARFLQRWFSRDVFGPVALHVEAKRYLVTVDRTYAATLSPSSRQSLAVQGGPLTPEAVRRFEAAPLAVAAVQLRHWDDGAKRAGDPVPSFVTFADLIAREIRPARQG